MGLETRGHQWNGRPGWLSAWFYPIRASSLYVLLHWDLSHLWSSVKASLHQMSDSRFPCELPLRKPSQNDQKRANKQESPLKMKPLDLSLRDLGDRGSEFGFCSIFATEFCYFALTPENIHRPVTPPGNPSTNSGFMQEP